MELNNNIVTITSREKQILRLVACEYSTPEISAMLHISVRTVETHRKNILRKTRSKSLVGLTKQAIRLGLIEGFYYNPRIRGKNQKTTDELNPVASEKDQKKIQCG